MFEFSEQQIKGFIQNGIQSGITDSLRNGYQHSGKFAAILAKSIAESESLIQAQLTAAILKTCQSEQFQAVITASIIEAVNKKFIGQFDGVIKATATRSAKEALVKKALTDVIQTP